MCASSAVCLAGSPAYRSTFFGHSDSAGQPMAFVVRERSMSFKNTLLPGTAVFAFKLYDVLGFSCLLWQQIGTF